MINPDLPIKKATEDILSRSAFAKSLARTILQNSFSSSFTIGLYGEWGSGKTSLLNMILESIYNTDESVVILRFNPWLCSDTKQLITQFFKQLASAIKLKKPASEKVWELVDQYADLFDTAELVPVVGPFAAKLGKVFGKGANQRVTERKGDLQKSKDQIIKKINEDNIKIIVTVNDIGVI